MNASGSDPVGLGGGDDWVGVWVAVAVGVGEDDRVGSEVGLGAGEGDRVGLEVGLGDGGRATFVHVVFP